MNRYLRLSFFLCMCALFAFAALPGCNKHTDKHEEGKKKDGEHAEHDKHLDYGPHGGPCAEWGDEDYHAEFIVDKHKKEITVYILDGTAKVAPKIDPAKIVDVKVTFLGMKPPTTIDLKHSKEESGEKGIAFIATHEHFAKPEELEVEISGVVKEKPFHGKVKYKVPAKTASLFLTPGGIYTVADIKANGDLPPMEKYKGIKTKHSKDLKPGDKVCPITGKKAQAELAWTVNGQSYQFCCLPCVEEFVEMAHHDAGKIKKASEYVH